MNLEATIKELEGQALQYQQAADALRALLTTGSSSGGSGDLRTAPYQRVSSNRAGAKPGQGGKSSRFSDETRAKISATLKARHAALKAAQKSGATKSAKKGSRAGTATKANSSK
jgi:hypothetical protein